MLLVKTLFLINWHSLIIFFWDSLARARYNPNVNQFSLRNFPLRVSQLRILSAILLCNYYVPSENDPFIAKDFEGHESIQKIKQEKFN